MPWRPKKPGKEVPSNPETYYGGAGGGDYEMYRLGQIIAGKYAPKVEVNPAFLEAVKKGEIPENIDPYITKRNWASRNAPSPADEANLDYFLTRRLMDKEQADRLAVLGQQQVDKMSEEELKAAIQKELETFKSKLGLERLKEEMNLASEKAKKDQLDKLSYYGSLYAAHNNMSPASQEDLADLGKQVIARYGEDVTKWGIPLGEVSNKRGEQALLKDALNNEKATVDLFYAKTHTPVTSLGNGVNIVGPSYAELIDKALFPRLISTINPGGLTQGPDGKFIKTDPSIDFRNMPGLIPVQHPPEGEKSKKTSSRSPQQLDNSLDYGYAKKSDSDLYNLAQAVGAGAADIYNYLEEKFPSGKYAYRANNPFANMVQDVGYRAGEYYEAIRNWLRNRNKYGVEGVKSRPRER